MPKSLVRNQGTGRVLPCIWGPCEKDGDARIDARQPHPDPRFPGEQLVYIFCSPAHRLLWLNGHRDHGNLPLH